MKIILGIILVTFFNLGYSQNENHENDQYNDNPVVETVNLNKEVFISGCVVEYQYAQDTINTHYSLRLGAGGVYQGSWLRMFFHIDKSTFRPANIEVHEHSGRSYKFVMEEEKLDSVDLRLTGNKSQLETNKSIKNRQKKAFTEEYSYMYDNLYTSSDNDTIYYGNNENNNLILYSFTITPSEFGIHKSHFSIEIDRTNGSPSCVIVSTEGYKFYKIMFKSGQVTTLTCP